MILEVEKKPLAVLEMPDPGQLPTSNLTLWKPGMMGTPPAALHTPVQREGRKGRREGREGREGGRKAGRVKVECTCRAGARAQPRDIVPKCFLQGTVCFSHMVPFLAMNHN